MLVHVCVHGHACVRGHPPSPCALRPWVRMLLMEAVQVLQVLGLHVCVCVSCVVS